MTIKLQCSYYYYYYLWETKKLQIPFPGHHFLVSKYKLVRRSLANTEIIHLFMA
jgi:hypothetical protein